MRRGTTYKHTFTVPLDLREATVYVTYEQNGKTIVEYTNDSLVIDNEKVVCSLSQTDTLSFSTGSIVRIQLRYVLEDGTAGASNIITATVGGLLKDGEITWIST